MTLTAADLRVMASALRLYHRTCTLSEDDVHTVVALVHLAERGETDIGQRCYAETISKPEVITRHPISGE